MPWLNRCISKAKEAMRSMPDSDAMSMEVMRRYFELLYDVEDLDKKQIMPLLNPKPLDKDLLFPFKEVASTFRFIEEDTIGIVIPREPEAVQLLQKIRHIEFPGPLLRKLQPYLVSVRSSEYARLNAAGALEIIDGEIPVLQNLAAYSDEVGLIVEEGEVWNVNDLII